MHIFHFIKVGVIMSTKHYPVAQVFATLLLPIFILYLLSTCWAGALGSSLESRNHSRYETVTEKEIKGVGTGRERKNGGGVERDFKMLGGL